MSNNQPPLNRSIFSADPLLSNTGDSPFPDPDQHSLFNPNFSTGQPRMMNGMGQISTPGVHDISSLLSNQHNPQSYNTMPPKPLGAGPMGQSPLTLNTSIFPQQPQLPPLNINPQPQMPPYPGAGINQMQPQIIQQMQMMQPNNQFSYYPNNMDIFRNRLPTNTNLPGPLQQNMNKPDSNSSMMRLLLQRQKNPLSPHIRQRSSSKKFISEDNEEEPIDDLPSSDEATFSNSSEDTDFENYPDDFVPPDVTHRRTAGRENRKTVQHDDEEVYIGDDEEESTADVENEITHEELLEKIYMNRITEGGIEYLVRFQDSPPALCSWIPEVLVNGILNSKSHLDRFNTTPFAVEDIPEDSNFFVPVAHRRDTPDSKPELLFRFTYDNKVLFYWDFGSDDVTRNYFNNKLKIFATNPPIPTIPPSFDEHTIQSKQDKSLSLLPYQVEGVNYLIKSWNGQHGSILADEEGLKKKVQVLSFLTYLNKNTEWHGPFLIVCRQNKFQQWATEINNWTDLNCLAYTSDPDQRNLMREYQFPALDDLGNAIPDTYAFNVFLVSYDILVKDIDFISKFFWEIFVVDDWQFINDKNGKRFNAVSKIKSHHHVVLTNKPIQNSLMELWTLLRFVSPTYFPDKSDLFDNEVDELSSIQIMTLREKIKPHVLYRTLQEVRDQDPSYEAAINSVQDDEKVVFVSPTQIQKDLLRLAKLHQLWRLKGFQTESVEEQMNKSKEACSLLKICSHPFLIPESERYYSNTLKMKRQDLLLNLSTKFQFLDHILGILKNLGHRVLIYSQDASLLKLINQFCAIKNFSAELMNTSSIDSESIPEIDKSSEDDSETFIYLLSSHIGFGSGIDLSIPTTAIVFDPDWNTEIDVNSLRICKNGRDHDVKKINIIRLLTYQTYEHEAFVRSEKKNSIWLALLGVKPIDELNQPRMGVTPIRPPPRSKDVMDTPINYKLPLDQVLDSISTVVRNYTLDSLDSIRNPIRMSSTNFYNETPSDERFLEQFPAPLDSGARRAKRNHSRDLLLDLDSSNRIYDLMLKYGYGEWNRIAAELPEHSSEQIRRFCICLSIFAFRAMPPSNITYLPVLAKKVLSEEQDFEFKYLLCSNKHTWTQVFPEDHEYALEVDSCKKLKDKLHERAFYFLSVVEMRLIAKCWCNAFSTRIFDCNTLSPPALDEDEKNLTAILDYGSFNPFDIRVQAIINKMRSDLISKQLSEEYAMTFDWWTGIEFDALISVLKNYQYDPSNMIEFHSRTAIMSKTTYQVKIFVTKFIKMLNKRQKGSLLIPDEMHMMHEAPKTLRTAKGFTSWVNILVRQCDDLSYRKELIDLIEKKVNELPDAPEPLEGWGDYHTKKFLNLLLQYGIDSLTDLLKDRRYGFKKFLTKSDNDFLSGKTKKRNSSNSQLPDFVFNEDDLYSFVRGDLDPFAKDEKDNGFDDAGEDGYSEGDDGANQSTITMADYQFSDDDDDASAVTGRRDNTQYAFEDESFSTGNDSPSDEEQDDFRPDDE